MVLSWLHTDGRYVKDAYGRIVRLRGAAVGELQDGYALSFGSPAISRYWGQADGSYAEVSGHPPNSLGLLKRSGANFVRFVVNWWNWMGISTVGVYGTEYNDLIARGMTSETYRQGVDDLIRELTSRDIYVQIMPTGGGKHESPSHWALFVDNYKADYLSWFQQIAQRYINNPAVMGFEIINEPRGFFNDYPYSGFWRDFCLEVAQVLHSVNPKLLVFVANTDRTVDGGTVESQMADSGYKVVGDQFALNPLPEPNIVYLWHHHYTWKEEWAGGADNDFWWSYWNGDNELAKQQYEAFLYKIAFRVPVEHNLPIMNNEFNLKRFRPDTQERLPYNVDVIASDLMDLMNIYDGHWSWWGWNGSAGYPWDYSPETNQLVYMGDQANYPYVWNTLSYLGEIWKDHLAPPTPPIQANIPLLIVGGVVLYSLLKEK